MGVLIFFFLNRLKVFIMFLFLNFYGQIEKCKNKLINPCLKNIFKFVIILMN